MYCGNCTIFTTSFVLKRKFVSWLFRGTFSFAPFPCYILDYWDSPVGQLGCLPSWGLVPICARLLSHVCPELPFPVLVIWYLSPGSRGPKSPFFSNSLCPILCWCPTIVLSITIGTLVWLPSQIPGNFRNILISSLLSRLGENMLLPTPHSPFKHNTYNQLRPGSVCHWVQLNCSIFLLGCIIISCLPAFSVVSKEFLCILHLYYCRFSLQACRCLCAV